MIAKKVIYSNISVRQIWNRNFEMKRFIAQLLNRPVAHKTCLYFRVFRGNSMPLGSFPDKFYRALISVARITQNFASSPFHHLHDSTKGKFPGILQPKPHNFLEYYRNFAAWQSNKLRTNISFKFRLTIHF